MKKHSVTRIGLDFDGVVAYNPLRIVRGPITFIKRKIFHSKTTTFYVPKSSYMKFLFWIPHQFSYVPGNGMEYLKELVGRGNVEMYIISGRYGYLDDELFLWIEKHGYKSIFTDIIVNRNDEQPHIFKERMLRELKIDYFVEDNFDIVEHLQSRVKTNILWLYNILDKNNTYTLKFSSLRRALEHINRFLG